MSGRRIFFLVTGSVLALIAIALLAVGAGLMWVHSAKRDSDGYYSTRAERFETTGSAIVSDNLDVGTDGPEWLFEEGRLATIRLRGSSAEAGKEIFIGIGRTREVNVYLDGASYDVVTDVNFDPFRVDYRRHEGDVTPETPGVQTFWAASVEGAENQTVRWEVDQGNWSAVVMNADASSGVAVDLSVGAKVGYVFWVGLGILIVGALILAGAAVLIYFGARKARAAAETTSTAPGPG